MKKKPEPWAVKSTDKLLKLEPGTLQLGRIIIPKGVAHLVAGQEVRVVIHRPDGRTDEFTAIPEMTDGGTVVLIAPPVCSDPGMPLIVGAAGPNVWEGKPICTCTTARKCPMHAGTA